MSASEKLKALEAEYHKVRPTWSDVDDAVIAALPQIVAVVEATDAWMQWVATNYPKAMREMPPDLFHSPRHALAALDEALS